MEAANGLPVAFPPGPVQAVWKNEGHAFPANPATAGAAGVKSMVGFSILLVAGNRACFSGLGMETAILPAGRW